MTTDSGLTHEFQGRERQLQRSPCCAGGGSSDYETGLSLSNGDWPDRLYAPEYAAVTLAKTTTYWVLRCRPTGSAGRERRTTGARTSPACRGRSLRAECKLYNNLSNGEGVSVWHPTDA